METIKCNKTHLSIDIAEKREIIHRDYLAHCMRWSHVLKHSERNETVLDLGCADGPLGMMLYTNKFSPNKYIGVDIREGQLEIARTKLEQVDWAEFLCLNLVTEFEKIPRLSYDKIVSFEFVEHIPGDHVEPFLINVKSLMSPNTQFFLSTPCYDGKNQAGNHIKEWWFHELKEVLERHFTIEQVYGTFMNQRDLKACWAPEEADLFDKLHNYYDSNVLAIIFAPLHPEKARNCIWRMRLPSTTSSVTPAGTLSPSITQ